MGATIGDRVVTLSSIVGAVCGDAADLLAHWYLAEQIGQHRGVADVAPGDLDGADLPRFLVDPEVDLPSDPLFGAAVLAGIPHTFALDLDAGAVDQLMLTKTRKPCPHRQFLPKKRFTAKSKKKSRGFWN